MNRRIWKALGIAVCMLALAAPRAMAETHRVGTDAEFKQAIEAINQSGDTENEIVLDEDITLEGDIAEYTLSRGKTTIKSKDKDHKITISMAGITVTGKGTVLNLGADGYDQKLTIERNTGFAAITVSGGATAYMYENVALQNRQSTINAYVLVTGSDPDTGSKSVFNMNGGVIEGGSRAVIAQSGATFNMSGGEIRNRKGGNGGGVRVYGATFVMSGGTINGCSADTGGGLYATNQSTITINKGTISGCTAEAGGGLYVDGSTITINKGTISGCTAVNGHGGGLYADNSTVTISGGTISKCTAPAYNGGGLYADHSTVTITDGTISGCDGLLGGGLYAEDSSTHSSTVTITDSTISGCKAGAGGGLYVVGLTLNIKDDIISECIASDTGKGGGLFADQSTLTISGGRIENNKAAYGGGVALRDSKVKKEDPITNWTVVGNKAYKTDTGMGYIGGGIYLENVLMDVSDGSNHIYNNTADGHGADIFLYNGSSAIRLPNAADMNVPYHNSGINIDGWYKDDNPRYKPSEDGKAVDAGVELNGGTPDGRGLSLVASYKTKCTVTIDANGGEGGSVSQTVQKGTTVTLEAPTKEGHLFKGWKDEKGNSYPAREDGKVHITVNENMKLKAVWEARTFTVTYVLLNGETRTETAAYGQNVTLGEEPRTGYTFVGWKDSEKVYHAGETITVTGDMTLTAEWKKLPSAENLPKTGDESPVLLWGAALAVSAAACFMLRRRK